MPEFLLEIFAGLFVLGCLLLWCHHEVEIRALRKEFKEAQEAILEEAVEMARLIFVGSTSWEEARAMFREEFPEPKGGSLPHE